MEQNFQFKNISELFAQPLILGASVSADYLSASPGRRLALRYTQADQIRTIARHGRSGRDTIQMIREKDFQDRSIVIGLDLFFWDSTLAHPHLSVQALHKLVEMVNKFKVHLVLGDIPELLPGWQQSRKIIQDEIHRICHINKLCILMPLEHLYKDTLKDGFISYKGKQHNLWELVPDGLHIGDVAGNYLADTMLNLLRFANPSISK